MPRRRRYGLSKPLWAPKVLDVPVERVNPYPGWVIVQELFEQDRTVNIHGVEIQIADIGTSNTVFGRVVRIHDEDAEALGVNEGDRIIYEQWQGGRWNFHNEKVLIMGSEFIFAKVV